MLTAINSLSEQALKAVNGLYSIFTRLKFDVKTKLHLFDRMVEPILIYCTEVFGVYNTNVIDKIHIKFCKKILGVKTQTPNLAVLGELGRYPMSLICKEIVLKYWIHVMSIPGSIIYKVFSDQRLAIDTPRNNSWAKHVKQVLNDLGFGYLWNNFNVNMSYLPMLKTRLRDQFQQDLARIYI